MSVFRGFNCEILSGSIIQNNPDKATNCKQHCALGSNEDKDFF